MSMKFPTEGLTMSVSGSSISLSRYQTIKTKEKGKGIRAGRVRNFVVMFSWVKRALEREEDYKQSELSSREVKLLARTRLTTTATPLTTRN
jgi:hypothetical protein